MRGPADPAACSCPAAPAAQLAWLAAAPLSTPPHVPARLAVHTRVLHTPASMRWRPLLPGAAQWHGCRRHHPPVRQLRCSRLRHDTGSLVTNCLPPPPYPPPCRLPPVPGPAQETLSRWPATKGGRLPQAPHSAPLRGWACRPQQPQRCNPWRPRLSAKNGSVIVVSVLPVIGDRRVRDSSPTPIAFDSISLALLRSPFFP